MSEFAAEAAINGITPECVPLVRHCEPEDRARGYPAGTNCLVAVRLKRTAMVGVFCVSRAGI